MKRSLACLLVAASLSTSAAFAARLSANDVAAVDAAIDKSNAALVRGDVDGVVDSTADQLLGAMGGRAKYAAAVQGIVKTMKDLDLRVASHTMEPPTEPVKAGDWLVTVVKESTVMETRGRRVRTDGFTVAVRPAAGGRWKLIGGKGIAQAPGIMAELFPGFPANYKFPAFVDTPL